MGHSRWDSNVYASHSASRSVMSRSEIFRDASQGMDERMDPKKITIREARDSDNHPNSTPIIIGLDVTGSMGMIAEYLAKTGLGVLVDEMLQRRPVADPTVCFMAVGDAEMRDQAPLQVGQFESDIVMAEWLEAIFLEGGGGGNNQESYDLPYLFGLYRTRTDAFEKRNEPGVLITIGDELPCSGTPIDRVNRFLGSGPQETIAFAELIESIRPIYTPYHIIIAEGHFAMRNVQRVKDAWREYLGNAAIVINDYKKTAELIVSMLDIDAGRSIDEALSPWNEETQVILRRSFSDFLSSGANRLSRRMDI